MRRFVVSCLVVLCGCTQGFEGEQGRLVFDTNLSRRGATWTPATPVARSSEVWVRVVPPFCLANCPRTQVTAQVEGGALDVLRAQENALAVAATREGTDYVRWTGTATDAFHVEVREAAGVGLTDPLLLALEHAPPDLFHLEDAGAWPDVSGALVLGPGGTFYVETTVSDDAGGRLGFDGHRVSVEGGDGGGWEVVPLGSLLDVRAPDAGATSFRVRWGDGGLARDVTARVAGPEEAASVELRVGVPASMAHTWVLKAVVTTDGGERFSEPPVQWALDEGFVDLQARVSALAELRPARDVRIVQFVPPRPGTFRPTARATVGGATAAVAFDVFEPEPPDAGVEPPPPPPPSCGCSAGAASPWPLAALVWCGAFVRRKAARRR